MTEREGVIKYSLDFTDGVLGEPASLDVLDAWRSIFKDTGLLGEDPGRYGGYGFGNLSVRTDRGFLITGSQTGNLSTTSSHITRKLLLGLLKTMQCLPWGPFDLHQKR